MNPIIKSITSYLDRNAIFGFVENLFDNFEWSEQWEKKTAANRFVVVKPNWVQESHEYHPEIWEPIITNPELVLAVIEVLAKKMKGEGTICLCDGPHTYADFHAIVARGGLKTQLLEMWKRWPSLRLELLDLRREIWQRKEEVVVSRRLNIQDPRGYARVNLGKDSLFYRYRGEGAYYGADYDSKVVNSHHHGAIQEYLIAGSPVQCDLFINMPKLKTHKKTGLTCCLKNLVGINGDKNWLPHHTEGTPQSGGDEFPGQSLAHSLEQRFKKVGRNLAMRIPGVGAWLYRKMRNIGMAALGDSEKVIRNGNWSGNDTCWRMALDLNRALLYANPNGSMREADRPKNYLAIVDGIIGGEGNGPLCPEPVQSGVLIAGDNPAAVDAVACKLMGFEPTRVSIVREAFADHRWPISTVRLDSIQAEDGRVERIVPLKKIAPAVAQGFTPHFGWGIIRDERRNDVLSD